METKKEGVSLLDVCRAFIAEADAAYRAGNSDQLQSIWARLNRYMREAVERGALPEEAMKEELHSLVKAGVRVIKCEVE